MSTKRVFDLPTRLFHWLFAASFLTAFTISNTVDDDARLFSYHMIAGLVMSVLILWRIVWGITGSRHARFSDFQLKPLALYQYLKSIFSKTTRLWSGHNPASSWAAVTMLLLGLGLGITGLLMTTGNGGDGVKDIHELLANAFLIVVLMHIAGIVIHTVKNKDPIGKSMINGHKQQIADSDTSVPQHALAGILLLVLATGFAGYLLKNFDPATKNLSIFGNQLHLSEFEDEGPRKHKKEHHSDDYDSDD